MRKILLVLLATGSMVSFSVGSLAAPYTHSPSASLTTGPSSMPYFIQGISHNPASNSVVLPEGKRFRMGLWSSFGFATEVGDVANFEEDLDDLIDLLDDDNIDPGSVTETLERFNSVLAQMEDDGYLKVSGGVTVPGFPMVYRSERFKGTFS